MTTEFVYVQHSRQIEECPYCHINGDNLNVALVEGKCLVLCVNCLAGGPVKPTVEQAIDAWDEVAGFIRDVRAASNQEQGQ